MKWSSTLDDSRCSTTNYFQNFGYRGLQILIIGQKRHPNKWLPDIKSIPYPKILLEKGASVTYNDAKQVLLLIHNIPRLFLLQNLAVGVFKFLLSGKNDFLICAGNYRVPSRKHFPGHRGMAMPDRFWVKLKNQTNFELLSTGKISLPKIFPIFDLKK